MIEDAAIAVENVVLTLFIGLHEHEKRAAQRFLVSTRIEVDPAIMSPECFFDYDPYIAFLNTLNGARIETQEEIAARIRDHFAPDHRVRRVALQLRKPDVFEHVGSVGIDVTFSFDREA